MGPRRQRDLRDEHRARRRPPRTTFATAGSYEVKLRVTDNAGNTGQTTRSVTVEQSGAGSYSSRVLATAGLTNYWRLGESSGTTLADSKGGANATVAGAPGFGIASALPG